MPSNAIGGVGNGGIFFYCRRLQSVFLSLELIDRRVRFAWDVGAGSSFVDHMLEIQSADQFGEEQQKWYRVVAKR